MIGPDVGARARFAGTEASLEVAPRRGVASWDLDEGRLGDTIDLTITPPTGVAREGDSRSGRTEELLD